MVVIIFQFVKPILKNVTKEMMIKRSTQRENNSNYSSNSFHVFKNNSVLLKTARAVAFLPDKNYSNNIRILSDSGTQWKSISTEACKQFH